MKTEEQENLINAILNASGFHIVGKDAIYDNTSINFDHKRVEMIKAVYKNDYEASQDCAKVLGCIVYF